MIVCKYCGNENQDSLSKCNFCNRPLKPGSITSLSHSGKSKKPPSIPSYKTAITKSPLPSPIGRKLSIGCVSKGYLFVLPASYIKKYGKPILQGEIKEVKERHVNQNSTIPLILGGVMMLRDFFSGLSMMYWGRNREIAVTSLILTENVTMRKREALLNQPQGSFPGIGDHVSLYGKEKHGVLLVKRGYNHDTNCELVCR